MESDTKFVNPYIKFHISNFTKDIQDEFDNIFEKHYYYSSGPMYLIFNLLSPLSVTNLSFLGTICKLDEINLEYHKAHFFTQKARKINTYPHVYNASIWSRTYPRTYPHAYNVGTWSPTSVPASSIGYKPLAPDQIFKESDLDHQEMGISKNIFFLFKSNNLRNLNIISFYVSKEVDLNTPCLFSVCGNIKYRNHITSALSNNQLSAIYYTMIANHLFRLIYSVFNLHMFIDMKGGHMASEKLQIQIFK